MGLSRVLKYLNLSIAAALATLLFGLYWFAWRPLPRAAGEISAPVKAPATASRDSLGVPHIAAANLEDAFFLQGFLTAQDRFWQMDVLRRLAAGELAEVAGPSAVEADREARRLRIPRIAEECYRALPPGDLAIMAAYARGVNFYLETHRDRLPLEFAVLRYDPRTWKVTDSILVALQMIRRLTSSWRAEALKWAMLEGGDPAMVDFLFPTRAGPEIQPGSNAWVLSGARTATGRPILASDPHLELSIPSVWYMIHLSAPGLNVTGASMPGLPCVIIGHNDRIAWGITNLEFDVEDLYLETFDPATGRYMDRGRVEQAVAEREVIRVKGGKPVEFVNWVTRRGPVFLNERGRFLSLRWIAADAALFRFPFLEINRAQDWPEFTAALARLPAPASNFVYADRDGNIGYHAAGKLPARKNFAGDVPVDGASGEFEWDGYIPFEKLPSIFNPSSGVLVTANQNPFPPDYPWPVSGRFAPHYRASRIADRLRQKNTWRAEEMLGIQTDVYSEFHHFLAREVVAAYDRRGAASPSLDPAVNLLRGWNGQMETRAAAPLVATLIFQHLRKAVAERAAPGKGLSYGYPMAPPVIERLLRKRPGAWFQDYGQLLLRCLADGVEEGRRMQGRDITKWEYGRYNALWLSHPAVGRLPVIGKRFNIGPVPMSGAPTTVKQSRGNFGPSMRMVVDLSGWDRSSMSIAAGQSGHVLSKHYKDQWDAYLRGHSFPMQFQNVEAKDVLRFLPER